MRRNDTEVTPLPSCNWRSEAQSEFAFATGGTLLIFAAP